MVIDNKESKGWGTLLHVIKRDPNAWVSSLKESIEPTLRLLNHLIATGPRLDVNTLHIKALFLEWTSILWLKWLTCSTGFIRPLYMVNVGWANHRGSFPPSILYVKGDLEIWFNTLLIASFPRPLRDGLLIARREIWISIFAVRGATSFSNDQSLVAWLWYSPHEEGGSRFETSSC